MQALRAQWQNRYGAVPPVGWLLRRAMPQRWLRIHSLPTSKRYADSDAERSIVLERHLTVASRVLGTMARCIVFVPRYPLPDGPSIPVSLPRLEHLQFESWDESTSGFEGVIHAAAFSWDPDLISPTLMAVAEDDDRALFLSLDTEQVYAPYDGGADVILRSNADVCTLREEFRSWLSARLDGM